MPTPEITLKPGDRTHGFVIESATPVDALRAVAYQIQHEQSGAQLIHLHADDAENMFSISFPTPPPDDTGLPHILEHAVLSGSRKFPVRDPFFEMLKMSMATFLNAMTGSDCTYYPVASNVKQDLFNLAEVYFDAVFHPLLAEETFKREGHHLAPVAKDQPTGDLTVSGIVYNEMKGAFSNPESRLIRCAGHGLFPDTIYGRESGGDPEHIPDLTYADFKRFHETFYHPSNARFFLYGDVPTEDHLAFLEERLSAFDRQPVETDIARQPRWSEPRSMEDSYPVGQDERDEEKTYVLLNWLVGDGADPQDVASLYALSRILLGNEAAPLRKAIIESKLGQDLVFSGYSSEGLESVFRVGLKGTERDRVEPFTELVIQTLTSLAEGTIEQERVQAAFQQAAYHYLEIMSAFPLHMMDRVLSAWVYGADPLTFLRMPEHLAACRQRYEDDPQFFNKLIRERLLDNPHRLTAVLTPDREWQGRTDAAFAERMKGIRAPLADDDLKRIADEADALDREAGTPNPPEALAKLPQLSVADLPPKPKHIPTTVEQLPGDVQFLQNDVFANGVNYLHLDFGLRGLPAELWTYLPYYADSVRKLGAAGMDYEQIAQRVAASTGGIGCQTHLSGHASDPARTVRSVRLSLKSLDEQIEPALAVLHDLLFGLDPKDRPRLRDVLAQALAHYQTDLVHNGSWTAGLHAARGLDPEGHLSDLVYGLPQLAQAGRLNEQFEDLADGLMAKIEAVRDFLLVRGRLTVSFTGSDEARGTVCAALSDWIGSLRDEPVDDAPIEFTPFETPPREGLAGPIQVAHCAQVLPAYHQSHPDAPLLTLGAHLVGFEHMLNEIRLKGGAYGAWCRYSGLTGRLSLGSYRDPHVTKTLEIFAHAADYVREAGWTQTDMDRAIIATAKNDEKPIRPAEATSLALHRHLMGLTPELREQRRERILTASAADVTRVTRELFETNLCKGAICVVASREKLEEANQQMPASPLAIEDILK